MTQSPTKTTYSVMISLYINKGTCRIMTDGEWLLPQLNALFTLGFVHEDVVIISDIQGKRFAIKCLLPALQLHLLSFLCVFGWEEKDGILYSPEQSCLDGGDITAVVNKTKSSLIQSLQPV